ncbi:hypothetical protein NAT51_13535 [Flavobacterium amniphilum]|uniref:hypothetical protein n=1 Tax=Flavobacterium amniphilum TaxID=1834035 RepID=UPI00202AB927|nr:hypothetical protein [Flavobacterium amniphilum]MCL9806552.1 hypothetical protein [Flavobacterium amniphilum]
MTHFLIALLQDAPEDKEFNLFLFAMLIAGLIFVCLSVLLAIVVAAVLLLLIFACITIGALSTSVLVGIHQKSFTSGFRTFILVFSTLGMTVIGTGSFWVFNRIVHWWSEIKAILIGMGAGLVSGLITGMILAFLIKKLSAFLKEKLDRKREIN